MISINVRGIAEKIKRRAIFDYYRQRGDIICIQETHSTKELENCWRNEWGGRILFSHGTSSSRGVCILFARGVYCNITDVKCDTAGRYIICHIDTDPDNKFALCNLYAPNKDTPSFFEEINHNLQQYSARKVLIGDYNLVLNTQLDRHRSDVNNHKSCSKLYEIMEQYYLVDVWRSRNAKIKRFSWKRTQSFAGSRIDFALISRGLDQMVDNCFYLNSLLTDHCALYMFIGMSSNERGPGFWKLNTSILSDTDVIDKVRKTIIQSVLKYENESAINKWVLLKKEATASLKSASRKKAQENKEIIGNLSESLLQMEERMPLTEADMDLYLKTKCDLEDKMLNRAKGIIFRSGVKWFEDGEKNTKYFYSLEKARYNNKTCQRIISEDTGEEISSDEGILQEQFKYYKLLYAKDSSVKFSIRNTHNVQISEPARAECEKEISITEVRSALKSLKSGKTPGADGIPVEFYRLFWNELEPLFMELIQECYDNHTMHGTAREGILNLIPKGNKDARFLKNLRPITLLNVDYKLIEKVLANRLDKVLHEIIHQDQTGFMKNRRIAVNIRKVYDIMQYCKKEDIQAVILNLDFVKCFDNIATESIQGSMEFFGIPPFIRNWVEILYTDFSIKVQNNGKFTDSIPVEKSVHQGGCISVQLFLLCAEIIALELRQCEKIQGIPIDDIIYLLNQYADDMNVSSLFEENSIKEIFAQLDWFRDNTGFLLSYEKTELYRIGSLHNTEAMLYTQNSIKWTNQPIKVLGIEVGYEEDNTLRNYTEIITKMTAVLNSWKRRGLSLIGKINVVNTLVASLFVYKMTVLPSIPTETVKKAECLIRDFIWNGRKEKIPLRTLQTSKRTGGLNLVNLDTRDKAIKISWIKILKDNDKMAHLAYHFLSPTLREDIWKCNINTADLPMVMDKNQNPFWFDVLKAWSTFTFTTDLDKASTFIWYNSLIKINGQVFLWKKSFNKGLCYVQQLFSNGKRITSETAKEKFDLDIMRFNSLVSAIPERWKQLSKLGTPISHTVLRKVQNSKNPSQIVYREYTQDRRSIEELTDKWRNEINSCRTLEKALRSIYIITNIPKLRSFQYRTLYKSLVLNMHLFRWGITSHNKCTFCDSEKETMKHLLFSCEKVRVLWTQMVNFLKTYTEEKIRINYENVILNNIVEKKTDIANFVCLIVKHYIYTTRCKKVSLNFVSCKQYVWTIENYEKYIAIKSNKFEKHQNKWYGNGLKRN